MSSLHETFTGNAWWKKNSIPQVHGRGKLTKSFLHASSCRKLILEVRLKFISLIGEPFNLFRLRYDCSKNHAGSHCDIGLCGPGHPPHSCLSVKHRWSSCSSCQRILLKVSDPFLSTFIFYREYPECEAVSIPKIYSFVTVHDQYWSRTLSSLAFNLKKIAHTEKCSMNICLFF